MRQLQCRQIQFAGERDGALRVLRRRCRMAEPLLEHRTEMMKERPLHPARRRQPALHNVESLAGRRMLAAVDQRGCLRMIDVEQIRLEPVSLGNCARLRHRGRRIAVTPVRVVPERQMRTPLHLHQRTHAGSVDDGRDARDQRRRGFACRLPVDVVEQRTAGHHPQVEIGLAVDERVETLRARRQVAVFRHAQQQRRNPRRACA